MKEELGMGNIYAQDGVDVLEGDKFSSFAARVCRSTYGNSRFLEVVDLSSGHFRGPRAFRFKANYPAQEVFFNPLQTLAPDGSGTKTAVSVAAATFYLAARDVIAMTAGDITRWGGLPLVFSNVLDTSSIGKEGDPTNMAAREVILGLASAAKELELIILNGETAELGVCVSAENLNATLKFNWSGVMFGIYDERRMILGNTLEEGHAIVVLKENGFRSNGISSVRTALALRFGPEWWKNPEAQTAIRLCAAPSVLYDLFLASANGWRWSYDRIPMSLIAHLTGGSWKSKMGEDILFPKGLSAELDDLFDPPEAMVNCANWRGMSDLQAYRTWNGGQGIAVVLNEKDVGKFANMAISFGIGTRNAGRIVRTPAGKEPSIRIKSKFGSGEWVTL